MTDNDTKETASRVRAFRRHVERTYANKGQTADAPQGRSFGEILCYELHEQPINPRMQSKTSNDGYCTGQTFRELAARWGIEVSFLGEVIADHCRKL